MVYRRLYINIIIRVLLIIVTSIWFAFVVIGPFKVYTLIVVISLIAIQGYLLIILLNSFNKEVYSYFASLKDSGSSVHFKLKKGDGNELYQLINEVGALISNARIDKEKQFQYLNFIVDNIPIGIIIVGDEGNIILSNNSINRILGIQSIKNLSILEGIVPQIFLIVKNLKVGETELIRMKIDGEFMKILVGLTDFKIGEEQIHLYTFQDVKRELDENEIHTWQKLIRVLNHELMNSITPITTLTLAIRKCLTEDHKIISSNQIDSETIKDVLRNAELIEERSKGLIQFINNYRNLTSIKKLDISDFEIESLLISVKYLFGNEIQLKNVEFTVDVNPLQLSISADKKLLEQVMINLVKNAIEALDNCPKPTLKIQAYKDSMDRTIISVSDNGIGIDESIMDDIFVPFYTTKKEGSGVGLSFSKQVMRMHGGDLIVYSEQGKGSTFVLSL